MTTPISYASHALNFEKVQSMPTQARPNQPKKKAPAPAATPASASSTPASTPAKATKPVAAAPKQPKADAAPAKSAPKKAAAPVESKEDAEDDEEDTVASPYTSVIPDRSPPVAKTYLVGFAMVKAVLSGDTLVLAGSSSGGVETPEKVITLTGVNAPKFGRGKNQTDEPFAWESREYMRKHVIGQQVRFTVQHTHADSGRDYGTVTLKGTDIATQMLKAGWVTVKKGAPGKDGKLHPEKEALLAIENEAAARNLGVHRKNPDLKAHTRTIDWTPDAQALFASNRGTAIAGVVDQVRDGSTLRVELIHPNAPLKHTMITLNLAGVSCPRTPLPLSVLLQQHERKVAENPQYKEKAPKAAEKPEPYALEAQAYTETRLLNRDVKVLLQGVDKSGNLFGTIVFTLGNITQKLLEQGFGKLVPWSASLTPDAEAFKQAEAQAKAQKLRIWESYVEGQAASSPTASSSSAPASAGAFEGKVISVPSSDSLTIENTEGKEVRVWLASLRAPRLATRGKDGKDEPYAQEAKEFLRSKLIGHKVRVVPEYVRSSAAGDEREARTFASIYQNKTNINESLILAGYAEAMLHRMDEERSQYYDLYLAAEAKAKEAKRGKHDPRAVVVTKVTDLTERVRLPRRRPVASPKAPKDGAEADGEEEEKNEEAAKPTPPTKQETEALAKNKQLSAKAKQYLVFLQREKQANAVVEFVFSASRFKLLVPKEHVMISFSLAGIRTPNPKMADGKPDPFTEEILQYVRSKIQQHSVKIEVETMDKADNYLGSLFHNRVNLAVDLLQQGYAQVFGFSAQRSPYSKDLYAAQNEAKAARRGVWKDWVEPTPEEKAAAGYTGDEDESKESGSTERVARITEIVDAGDFYVQWVGDKNAEAVATALAAVAASAESEPAYTAPENGTKGRSVIAAGQFGDDTWHRVRLDGQDGNGDWNVYFIDFGNYDTMLADRVRALPVEAQKIPPLAVHAALAGVMPPRAPEYQEGSALAFSEMAFGVDLKARVEYTDGKSGKKYLTLSHESHPISVNRQLLRDGWAKVPHKLGKLQPLQAELQEEERYAKDNHFNIFEYGDVSDEDEETAAIKGPDPKARGQKPVKK